jgi:recombination DNA repair RAD52 pathway protein
MAGDIPHGTLCTRLLIDVDVVVQSTSKDTCYRENIGVGLMQLGKTRTMKLQPR